MGGREVGRDSLQGLYWDNGKENGNYYSTLGLYRVTLGLYRDNGNENGNYDITVYIGGYIGDQSFPQLGANSAVLGLELG